MKTRTYWLLATLVVAGAFGSPAAAQTCIGTCGASGPDGVVTAPPSGSGYQYVSTANGVVGAGQIAGVPSGSDTANGSEYLTSAFTAAAGDNLAFYFNFVTSDGTDDYTDYAFAELLSGGSHAAWLFTARTSPGGNASPGVGLPNNDSTLDPGSTPIVADQTTWSPLGDDSGTCYGPGCGYTGWIRSDYRIALGGSYQVRFGVSNIGDDLYNSGLAFAGLTLNEQVPGDGGVATPAPEPATWAMMIVGFGLAGASLRRRRVAPRVRFA